MSNYRILLLFSLCLIIYPSFAEPVLKVWGINTEAYPKITAKYFLLDNNGKQDTLNKDEFFIYENDIEQQITDYTNPPLRDDNPISLAISIQISTSMFITDVDKNPSRFDLAKKAAIEIIKGIKNPLSEVAIQVCSDKPQLILDYSTDRNLAINKINSLTLSGNFNPQASIYDKDNGLLSIAKRGKFRRGALTISDTYKDGPMTALRFDSQLKFNQNEITYFVIFTNKTVPLDSPGIPVPFAYLAIHTGGDFIDSVTKSTRINDTLVQRVLFPLQGITPCSFSWKSKGVCSPSRRLLALNWRYRIEYRLNFYNTIQSYLLPRIEFPVANNLDFGMVSPGNEKTMDLMIQAVAGDIDIDTITTSNTAFTITDFGGNPPPFTIPDGGMRTFKVKFAPQYSNMYFGGFHLINSGCSDIFVNLKGGWYNTLSYPNKLDIVRPNGGETFVAGSKIIAYWNGTDAGDTVNLDYSIDNGRNYTNITKKATNLEYNWKVPNVSSDSCLMKVYIPGTRSLATLHNHHDSVYCSVFSPDSKYIASGGTDSSLILWDAQSFSIIKIFKFFPKLGKIKSIAWRPDSRFLAVSGEGNNVYIVDVNDYNNYTNFYPDQHEGLVSVAWSPNMQYFMCAARDGSITVWSSDKFKLVRTVNSGSEYQYSASWGPNSMQILSTTNYATNIWKFPSGEIYKTVAGGGNHQTKFSPDGRMIATGSGGYVSVIKNDSVYISLPRQPLGSVISLEFSPDGKRIATAASNMTVYLFNIENQTIEKTYLGHTAAVNSVSFSPDGMFIASGSADKDVRIWEVSDTAVHKGTSDSVFKIIKPDVYAVDVDFGKIPIGTTKDTLVTAFLTNTGTVGLSVDSMKLAGTGAYLFRLIDGLPPYSLAVKAVKPLKMSFSPKDTSKVRADIKIYTQNDTITVTASGEGIKSPIAVVTDVVDFGKVFLDSIKTKYFPAVKNISQSDLTIDSVKIAGNCGTQFTISSGGGSFLLPANSANHIMSVDFSPKKVGKMTDTILFSFQGSGSPAIIRLTGEGAKSCDSLGFLFNDFSDISRLNILEDARASRDNIMITPAGPMSRGALWYNIPVPVSSGFESEFRIRMSGGTNNRTSDGSSPGGDGFAFVVQAYHPFIVGTNGAGIGYDGIPNSLAVEFDTFGNDSLQIQNFGDPNGNHAAVQTNNAKANTAVHGQPQTLAINANILPLIADSTLIYNVKIDYSTSDSTLKIYIDTLNFYGDPVISIHPFLLDKEIGLYNGKTAYIGITAATGYAWERHDVLGWSFCPGNFKPTDVATPGDPGTPDGNLKVYPNPADGLTTISFDSYSDETVKLTITDNLGNINAKVLDSQLSPGHHDINFDTKNLASGIYYCTLTIGDFKEMKQLVVVK